MKSCAVTQANDRYVYDSGRIHGQRTRRGGACLSDEVHWYLEGMHVAIEAWAIAGDQRNNFYHVILLRGAVEVSARKMLIEKLCMDGND